MEYMLGSDYFSHFELLQYPENIDQCCVGSLFDLKVIQSHTRKLRHSSV